MIDVFEEILQYQECEFIEYKKNFHSADEIGERISAISNSACLHNKSYGYMVFGVEDSTREVVGTSFKAKSHKKGNEILELWLINRLDPKIDFKTFEFDYKEGIHISMYRIPAASGCPVKFTNKAYIRVNSATRPLSEFPAKEEKIWKNDNSSLLSQRVVKDRLSPENILSLLNTSTYFKLLNIPIPTNSQAIIEKFIKEKLVARTENGYGITFLGAILFARNINDFDGLNRKAVRVIVYSGTNKVDTNKEQPGTKGYAVGFVGLIDWVLAQLPQNEEIERALRKNVQMYPQIAIRELIANSIIHQDFIQKGSPMIEIYSDRIEISNPGVPIIDADRFIDEYGSRNDTLADLMRRLGFCEEKGSGLDKVIYYNEIYQLPPIKILVQHNRTIVTMYSYKPLNKLDKNEKIRACYQHACLKQVSNDKMTNQSLRERFKIEDKNAAIASRIIKDTIDAQYIKEDDPQSNSKKYKKYIPIWA